eukprot:g2713.t1
MASLLSALWRAILRHPRRILVPALLAWMARLVLQWYRLVHRSTKLKGKNVWISGGGNGIGRAVAFKLARRGANIILCDINKQALQETRAEISKAFPSVHCSCYACDVSDARAVESMAATVKTDLSAGRSKSGEVDVIINNAGIVVGKHFASLQPRHAERTVMVNSVSNFYTLHHFLVPMIERNEGHFVTVASVMGIFSSAMLSDYCASKAAQISMHESIRLELYRAAPRVRSLLICPWAVDSGMFRGIFEGDLSLGARLSRALFPSLTVDYVATRIVNGIENGEASIAMPLSMHFLPSLIKMFLPTELYDALSDAMGGNEAMAGFKGR